MKKADHLKWAASKGRTSPPTSSRSFNNVTDAFGDVKMDEFSELMKDERVVNYMGMWWESNPRNGGC